MVRLRSPAPYGSVPERPKGADCKSVVTDFGGSNPPSPTMIPDPKRSGIIFYSDTKGLQAFFSKKLSFIFVDAFGLFPLR